MRESVSYKKIPVSRYISEKAVHACHDVENVHRRTNLFIDYYIIRAVIQCRRPASPVGYKCARARACACANVRKPIPLYLYTQTHTSCSRMLNVIIYKQLRGSQYGGERSVEALSLLTKKIIGIYMYIFRGSAPGGLSAIIIYDQLSRRATTNGTCVIARVIFCFDLKIYFTRTRTLFCACDIEFYDRNARDRESSISRVLLKRRSLFFFFIDVTSDGGNLRLLHKLNGNGERVY